MANGARAEEVIKKAYSDIRMVAKMMAANMTAVKRCAGAAPALDRVMRWVKAAKLQSAEEMLEFALSAGEFTPAGEEGETVTLATLVPPARGGPAFCAAIVEAADQCVEVLVGELGFKVPEIPQSSLSGTRGKDRREAESEAEGEAEEGEARREGTVAADLAADEALKRRVDAWLGARIGGYEPAKGAVSDFALREPPSAKLRRKVVADPLTGEMKTVTVPRLSKDQFLEQNFEMMEKIESEKERALFRKYLPEAAPLAPDVSADKKRNEVEARRPERKWTAKFLALFTAVGVSLASYGVPEADWRQYQRDVEAVGAPLTERVERWAQAAWGLPGAEEVVRGVATGFRWQQGQPAEFFQVENYVPPEHQEKVLRKLLKEEDAGRMVASLHRVRVKQMERLVGQLMFCARMVYGAKMFLRSGYDFIGRARRMRRVFDGVPEALVKDLTWLARLLETNNGQAVVLNKRPVVRDFFAVDAAREEAVDGGMGGFFGSRWFSVKWEEVRNWKVLPFSPFRDVASSHINYLELFVIFWALKLWGHLLRGCKIVLWSDNEAARLMTENLWGKATFVPLLKEILLLSVKHDLRIVTKRISSKANGLADALSRSEMGRFFELLRGWSQREAQRDLDDSMVNDWLWERARQFGPFVVDACCDEVGANSRSFRWWSKEDSCSGKQWRGLSVHCNPPFSLLWEILVHFLSEKRVAPGTTSAVFVLPLWPTERFWAEIVLPALDCGLFEIVEFIPEGSLVFTSPNGVRGKVNSFNVRRVLRRRDFAVRKETVWVRLVSSKTIQFHERSHVVAMKATSGLLCPKKAVCSCFEKIPAEPESPAFMWKSRGKLVPMTHGVFVAEVKKLIRRIGLDPKKYSGHSFRRGGATVAFNLGVDHLLIKLQGDWVSNAYQ
eukprot:gene34178-biopygen18299